MIEQRSLLPIKDFDFDGGRLCLDFVNTALGRASGSPSEKLEDYGHLLNWGVQAHIVDQKRAERLLETAQERPGEAEQSLQETRTFREALYRLLVTDREAHDQADLAVFNSTLAEALGYSRLVEHDSGLALGWDEQALPFNRVLWDVVRSAVELLTSDDMQVIRTCANKSCDWVFLDTSKNRSRRWCSMKSCGNRAKARRHQERQKQAVQAD